MLADATAPMKYALECPDQHQIASMASMKGNARARNVDTVRTGFGGGKEDVERLV